jgi:GNAT superfamily N-acetyltransferase
MYDIFLPETDSDIQACFDVFSVLRPHLTSQEFLPRVRRQAQQGYQIAALRSGNLIASAAGFRICEFLAWGRILYIDDLSTLPSLRGQGHAGAILDWLTNYASEKDCEAIHLDTGYGRHAAHRVYLRKGFELNCHHMAKTIQKQ